MALSSPSTTFSVLQFNTLADGLSSLRPDHGGFLNCPEEVLEWSYRGPKIIELLRKKNADIICLEEVDHFDDFDEVFKADYAGFFLPKADSPCLEFSSFPDGCAVFIRKSKFTVEKLENFTYKSHDGSLANQVAIVLLLRSVEDASSALIAAVTHLKATKTPEGESIRANQIAQLLEKVQEVKGGVPVGTKVGVVIAGDFNAEPTGETYAVTTSHTLSMRSAYHGILGSEPELTSFKIRAKGTAKYCIDYIFHNDAVEVIGVDPLATQEEIGVEGMPSKSFPSDHLPLKAEFRL